MRTQAGLIVTPVGGRPGMYLVRMDAGVPRGVLLRRSQRRLGREITHRIRSDSIRHRKRAAVWKPRPDRLDQGCAKRITGTDRFARCRVVLELDGDFAPDWIEVMRMFVTMPAAGLAPSVA